MATVIDFEKAKQLKLGGGSKVMKFTFKDVSEFFSTIQVLSLVIGEDIPVRVTYRIGKVYKKFEKKYKDFMEQKQNLFKKYAIITNPEEKDLSKQQATIPFDKINDHDKEMNDFLKEEFDIEVMPISLIEFYRYKKTIQIQQNMQRIPYQITGKEIFDVEFIWSDITEENFDELLAKAEAEEKAKKAAEEEKAKKEPKK